jgi:SAM-dependent MidA family methyltransferase
MPAMHIMTQSARQILEIGAGSGTLAVELLLELERLGSLPDEYRILELSGELRARQQAALRERAPQLLGRVAWLDTLPQKFSGLVLGNEVLDAMPASVVEWHESESAEIPGIAERGVMLDDQGGFVWANRPAQGLLLQAAQGLGSEGPYPYTSEIGLAASAWVAEWGQRLECGALLLIDYGFPRPEFYHPQRSNGTLMCHYRHHAHDDPFWWPGLNDITAHVDFTAIAEAGFEAGLDVLGYTSQANFLLDCGITEVLGRLPNDGGKVYVGEARNVAKLLSPGEMGELFKVIALGRGLDRPLAGFITGDRLHTL